MVAVNPLDGFSDNQVCSTVFRTASSEAGSSRTIGIKSKPRKRPYKSRRKSKPIADGQLLEVPVKKAGLKEEMIGKRKADLELVPSNERRGKLKVVPNEGPPKC